MRNPTATGGLTVLAGWVFSQLAASMPLFAGGLMGLFVVYVQEPKLERVGQSYRGYKSRVNRWHPSGRTLGG